MSKKHIDPAFLNKVISRRTQACKSIRNLIKLLDDSGVPIPLKLRGAITLFETTAVETLASELRPIAHVGVDCMKANASYFDLDNGGTERFLDIADHAGKALIDMYRAVGALALLETRKVDYDFPKTFIPPTNMDYESTESVIQRLGYLWNDIGPFINGFIRHVTGQEDVETQAFDPLSLEGVNWSAYEQPPMPPPEPLTVQPENSTD